MLKVVPQPNGFGACVTGIRVSQPMTPEIIEQLRSAWLSHRVLWFPDQPLEHSDFERFTLSFGEFGNDPFVTPIEGHQNILEVRREPSERVSPFGSSWHSDWSFQSQPPSATLLHAKVVPPLGGDTLYADGHLAYDALPAARQRQLDQLVAIHSAKRPYSHEGFLAGGGTERSMRILPSDSALATQEHPVVRTHPETGRKALWVNRVYTIGIKGMTDMEAHALLRDLFDHAVRDEFTYRHQWAPDMLTMWDNRCVQHCAQGGYDGHRRVMHRTTVAGCAPH